MKFRVKIVLLNVSNPEVWRVIDIPVYFSFDRFHQVLQAAFGWRNMHLYSFSENGLRDLFSITSHFDEESGVDGRTVEISKVLLSCYNSGLMSDKARTIKDIYDYGDNWEHEITVEALIPEDDTRARLIDGHGACPPEDCGGEPGFEDLKLSLITGKNSEIHGEPWIPWLEATGYSNYSSDEFDLEEAKKRVSKI